MKTRAEVTSVDGNTAAAMYKAKAFRPGQRLPLAGFLELRMTRQTAQSVRAS